MVSTDLAVAFSSNRTEEYGFDVWDRFVIPSKLNIDQWHEILKPRVIVGGRGCGKTMLLRYLSHDSAFSPTRPTVNRSTLKHIGIYWRADTQFTSLLEGQDSDEEFWRNCFNHLSALVIGKEVLRALESIANSQLDTIGLNELNQLDYSRLSTPHIKVPQTQSQLSDFFDDSVYEFENWINNIKGAPKPFFMSGSPFIKRLIQLIVQQLEQLQDVVFFIYIDEYENLTELQQRIVNTWLKHSEPPLIFNVAMKRKGFKTNMTLGEESIVETHDYRQVDLEDFAQNSKFPLFAAEILLLRLHTECDEIENFDPDLLRNPIGVSRRQEESYTQQRLAQARNYLPTWSRDSLVKDLFNDHALLRQLELRIAKGLRQRNESKITPAYFLNDPPPTAAAVTIPALLARKRLSTVKIVDEFYKFCVREPNGFEHGTEWLKNIFVASYLDLFTSLGRVCPIYSGFDTYCHMAKGNVRHFLELCYKAFASSSSTSVETLSATKQAEAASQVAVSLLPEVRSFGHLGNNLHSFLLRLGRLFALSQRRSSQSEPERTHFAIRDGEDSIGKDGQSLLSEAVKWAVLFEEKETKVKSIGSPQVIDYVLNPIYSPYFNISYRKGRKLSLSASDFDILSTGTADDYKFKLFARLSKEWDIDQQDAPEFLMLWSEETEENNF